MTEFLSSTPRINHKKSKRLGRGLGSGAGSKSGRGTTRHQTARGDMPIHFEGGQNRLVKKFPLLRGKLRNKSRVGKYFTISLSRLEKIEANTKVDIEFLMSSHLFRFNPRIYAGVKIVGNGSLSKPLQIQLPVTRTAKEAIVKAGGSVQ